MSRNLEAKITKQMRDLIEIKLAKQNETPEQAINDMDVFIQDFNSHERYLINQYAKYIKHLVDHQLGTKNAWEKFLNKLEEHRLSKKLDKSLNKESLSDKQAFKQSLDDLKEYDRLSRIVKSNKKNSVEEINIEDKSDKELFNPFDEEDYAELANIAAIENEQDDWTINDDEFDDEITMDTNSLGTLERNIDFSDTQDVEQLKEEFSKIKSQMQDKIDDLSQQVEALKYRLANYEIDKLDGYDIADETDDEALNDKLAAQKIPDGQQVMDFAEDHTKEKLEDIKAPVDDEDTFAKTEEQTAVFDEDVFKDLEEDKPKLDKQWVEDQDENTMVLEDDMAKSLAAALDDIDGGEEEPTAVFSLDTEVSDKDGNTYHVAGSRKTSGNRTKYLVRNDDGETFTFDYKDLIKK